MKQTGFIVYPGYRKIDNQMFIEIYGRLENDESFLCIFDFKPYFYMRKKDEKKIKKKLANFEIEKTELKNFFDEEILKISHKDQTELNKLLKEIRKEVPTYEADIKPQYRFLIDNELLSTLEISGDYETSEKINRIYRNPEISPGKGKFKNNLKIASIDIETGKSEHGDLFCIGIKTEKVRKNFMITNKKIEGVISCRDEFDCLDKFRQEIIDIDPDIITGWNMIDFDLKYLQESFKKNKVPFDLGRNNDTCSIRIESGFFRASSADIPGRQVIDALNLIKDPFIKEAPTIKKAEFESFTLEDISQALIKKGKLLKGKGRHEDIERLYHSEKEKDLKDLAEYNLRDCELVYEIIEETKMIDLAIERSQLTGMPIDRLTASIAAFDSLYLREAKKSKLVCPTSEFKEKQEKIKGGYVKDSIPGIYHNVLILDFKSLYPSIIKTFNIDPASFIQTKYAEKNIIVSPNGAKFKNQEGLLPEIISKLHKARELAKSEKRELSSYAIKIIMNSFFGVLASPNCRFFNLDMANAITHFGQMIIKMTAEEIEKKFKNKVIYQDTDSIFFTSGLSKNEANRLGKEIEEYINKFYKEYVKKNYNRTSFLELEFEKQYISMIIPNVRMKKDSTEKKGAKKRYAGLIEKNGKEEIEIVGLEAIRGDWTEAAQDFQREILMKIFHKEEVSDFVRKFIDKIKSGKIDEKLIYKKSIRKSLDEYTKTTPPHVKAARKLEKMEGNLIQYYITINGPEPIQNKKSQIDYNHYIEKQIKPIAEQVLLLFNKKFEETVQKTKQSRLF